jgi:probable phosphoglycerate mutase
MGDVRVGVVGHPRRLWLIRHGESAGNVANLAAIRAGLPELDLAERDMDVPLSEAGEAQATALAAVLRALPEPPDVVWCSPYRRALDTARIAMEEAALDVPLHCDERLREREFGVLDRLTKVGIEQRFPEQAQARTFLGKFFHRPPGGESWADVALRVRTVLTDLRMDHAGQGVMVVAHQAVLVLFRYVLEDLDEQRVLALDRDTDIANTGVTTYLGDGTRPPTLVSFNDVSHLPPVLETAEPARPAAPR